VTPPAADERGRRVFASTILSAFRTLVHKPQQVANGFSPGYSYNGDGANTMLNNAMIGLCAGFAALVAAPLAASAQDAIAAPGQKTIGQPQQSAKGDMIPSLAPIAHSELRAMC
jgi:hypothetical protein